MAKCLISDAPLSDLLAFFCCFLWAIRAVALCHWLSDCCGLWLQHSREAIGPHGWPHRPGTVCYAYHTRTRCWCGPAPCNALHSRAGAPRCARPHAALVPGGVHHAVDAYWSERGGALSRANRRRPGAPGPALCPPGRSHSPRGRRSRIVQRLGRSWRSPAADPRSHARPPGRARPPGTPHHTKDTL